ncbi:MAG: hypothetical protein HRU19_27385 [Pseudobacteriovorax sp.]|nr:hypothetical protein [Pseudobacteriovorax sp.]
MRLLLALAVSTILSTSHATSNEYFSGTEDWTFVSVEGSYCRDGTEAGYFVKQGSSQNNKLMIYLGGGGACFNFVSCAINRSSLGQTPNDRGILSSSNPENPFRDWAKIFVPYCSGDVFAGTNLLGDVPGGGPRNQTFVGYNNIGLFSKDWVESFPNPDQVLLSGSSAGGIGATINFDQVQEAFQDSPLSLITDSGIIFSDDYMKACLQDRWRNVWGISEALPKDCDACQQENGGGLSNYFRYIMAKYPDLRGGVVSSYSDAAMRFFFGYGAVGCNWQKSLSRNTFRSGLIDVVDNYFFSQISRFYFEGKGHVHATGNSFYELEVEGTKLVDWYRFVIEGEGFDVAE